MFVLSLVYQKIIYKINTFELFWKRIEIIWGIRLPNFNIWVSHDSEKGAWKIESLVVILKGHLIAYFYNCW